MYNNENDNDNENENEKNDICCIGLQLCSLPSNISSIVVQIKFNCLQSQNS